MNHKVCEPFDHKGSRVQVGPKKKTISIILVTKAIWFSEIIEQLHSLYIEFVLHVLEIIYNIFNLL